MIKMKRKQTKKSDVNKAYRKDDDAQRGSHRRHIRWSPTQQMYLSTRWKLWKNLCKLVALTDWSAWNSYTGVGMLSARLAIETQHTHF